MFDVKQGEVLASVRYLVEITGWSKGRVVRFLDGHTNGHTSETRNDHTGRHTVTVIKVCNSSYFQEDGHEVGHTDEKKRTHRRVSKRGRIQKVTESTERSESTESTLYINNTRKPKKTFNPDPIPEENDCWFESEAEWMKVREELGHEEAYALAREVTQWVRKKNHLEGKFWQMDPFKLMQSFLEKHRAKGKRFFVHPEHGEGFFYEYEIRKVA